MVNTKQQTMSNFDDTLMTKRWTYVNDRFGGTNENKESFFADLKAAAADQEITREGFIVAHAMWHGDGVIRPEIFSGDQSIILKAIKEGGNGSFANVENFIKAYLAQY